MLIENAKEKIKEFIGRHKENAAQVECAKFEDFLNLWEQSYFGGYAENTKRLYSKHNRLYFKPIFGHYTFEEITRERVQTFINSMYDESCLIVQTPQSPKSVRNLHGELHKALEVAKKLGYIENNPADGTVLPKKKAKNISLMQTAELEKFGDIFSAPNDENSVYRVICAMALLTGMRQSELIGLKREYIDFDNVTIDIKTQLIYVERKYIETPPKHGVVRIINPPQCAMEILKSVADNNNENCPYIFQIDGKHLSHSIVGKKWRKFAALAELDESFRFHDLRHNHAVQSLAAGVDYKTLQHNLGHSTPEFTLHFYGHVIDEMRATAAEKLQNRLEKFFAEKTEDTTPTNDEIPSNETAPKTSSDNALSIETMFKLFTDLCQ